jgi:ubiquinone/menaquinone biosynthesis C-methylase UbiE
MNGRDVLVESPHNAILGLAQKFILSRVLMIFSELGLENILSKKPCTLIEIAKSLSLNPIALRRFLRLLTAHHIIKDMGDDVYASTPMSQYFDHILQENLFADYQGIDKAIESLKSNEAAAWSNVFSQAFNNYLAKAGSKTTDDSPKDHLLLLAHEFILSKVIMGAAELKLGKLFVNGNLSLDQIAQQLKIPAVTLKPFLKILVDHCILKEPQTDVYSATSLSDCFDRILSPHILDGYKVFSGALYALQHNTGSWEHVFDKSFYEYLNQDAKKLQMFKEWCVQSAIDWLPPILSSCDFPEEKTIVDVAGGGGHFLASVLERNPEMTGVLFEQPSMLNGAEESPVFAKVKSRVKFEGGDFFKKIPEGGDIYTICRTLLNWSDEKSIEIINNCFHAMKGKGRLWLIDFVVPDPDHPKYPRAVINDISLFVIFNSAIRTEVEWRALLSKTLFTVSKVYITREDSKPEPFYPMCIIEASPKVQSINHDNSEPVGTLSNSFI